MRGARPTIANALYVRLVDLDRALGLRTCPTPVDVVLDVRDAFCPWNTQGVGDYQATRRVPFARGRAIRPMSPCLATELGAAYLGGTSLGTLALAPVASRMTRGSLAVVDRAFRNEPLLVSGDVLTVRFASACSLPGWRFRRRRRGQSHVDARPVPDSDGLALGHQNRLRATMMAVRISVPQRLHGKPVRR